MTSASVLAIEVGTCLKLRRSRLASASYENGGRGRFTSEAEVVLGRYTTSIQRIGLKPSSFISVWPGR
jgi:hypothetical protein